MSKTALEHERWNYINALEDDFMKGGYILSEYASELVRTTDLAFAGGAFLAAIITATAGIETYLRSESGETDSKLVLEIAKSDFPEDIKVQLHELRKYRNRWVHVKKPWEDEIILGEEALQKDLEQNAMVALRLLRFVIYSNPWI